MPNTTISPNMGLIIPTVAVDPGPDWANNVNASFSILDGHNHSAGEGVQIQPDGLNINTDLTFLNNNATNLRSARFAAQPSPLALVTDIGAIYEAGVDLYYNDGNGNQIRLTQNGSIAGTSGSISGLVPPASVSYSSGTATFIFQSNINTPANLDAASIVLRNLVANSFGLTLSPPPAMSGNFSIVLPELPSVDSVLTIDPAGNISTTVPSSGLTTRFVLSDATIIFQTIDGCHYQQYAKVLNSIFLTMLNSGDSGMTTVQVNQYRSGALFNSATASLPSASAAPAGASCVLSGTLTLAAGDIITVDSIVIPLGIPSELTIEF